PSSLHDQPVARSGTIVWRLACATCWSYMTKLLKTPIIGCSAARVASSRIDIEAVLSKWDSRRMPPDFWARAGLAARHRKTVDAANRYAALFIACPPWSGLVALPMTSYFKR